MAIPVVIMGLGEVGQAITRAVLTVPELEIVGALDLSPERIGKTLGEVTQSPPNDVVVTDKPDEVYRAAKGGVLLHAAGSRLEQVAGDIETAIKAGLSVVSTCEELACPWVRNPKIAEHLDRLAQKRGTTVLGTGVNPGFILDRLVATLAQVVGRVERVHGIRVVDASFRREALQRKIGAGLTEAEFNVAVDKGAVGHVGLMESVALCAMGIGHSVDEVDEEILPVFAEAPLKSLVGRVEAGRVAGVRQIARAFDEGSEVARLDLTIALGAANPRDEISIVGKPSLTMQIPGGTPGDEATPWAVVHAAALLGQGAEPGLITVLDLPAGR